MLILKSLLFIYILINSNLVLANMSEEEATQCYAISSLSAPIFEYLTNYIANKLSDDNYLNSQSVQKRFEAEEYLKLKETHAHEIINKSNDAKRKFRIIGINKLIKSGRSISDANQIFDRNAVSFINKKLILDPTKISTEDYYTSLMNLQINCVNQNLLDLKKID